MIAQASKDRKPISESFNYILRYAGQEAKCFLTVDPVREGEGGRTCSIVQETPGVRELKLYLPIPTPPKDADTQMKKESLPRDLNRKTSPS